MTEIAINEVQASRPARPPRSASALAAARSIGFLAIVFLGAFLGGIVESHREAKASRNSAGTYSTPNTFVTGTATSATTMNANFSDLATEMTDSLDRSGKGGMLAALRGVDGTVSSPAFSWTSETGTGQYRIGAGDVGFAILGVKVGEWTAGGLALTAPSGSAPLTANLGGTGTSNTETGKFKYTGSGTGASNDIGLITSSPAAGTNAGQSAGDMWVLGSATTINNGSIGLGSWTNAAAGDGIRASNGTTTLFGNVKIGSGSTAITQINTGTCTLNGGSPSTCTATVASGAKCVANLVAAGAANGVSFSLSGTTATFTCSNGLVNVVDYFCF